MSRILRGYTPDGHSIWEDLGPGYARVAWTGQIAGRMASPERRPVIEARSSEAAAKGWETRKRREEEP